MKLQRERGEWKGSWGGGEKGGMRRREGKGGREEITEKGDREQKKAERKKGGGGGRGKEGGWRERDRTEMDKDPSPLKPELSWACLQPSV